MAIGLARRAGARQSPQLRSDQPQALGQRQQPGDRRRSAAHRPTAAEPMSLTRPICGSIARLTRSASFSIAVLRQLDDEHEHHDADQREPLPGLLATRKASGTATTSATSSWRNASSLRAAARRPCQVLMAARSSRSMGCSMNSEGSRDGLVVAIYRRRALNPARPCRAPWCNPIEGEVRPVLLATHGTAVRIAAGPALSLIDPGRLELLPVEAESHDLLLDHTLHH